MMFCLVDAPDRDVIEKRHSKFGLKCELITPVRMISEYNVSE